ncbi:MAG: hypothetical protein GY854_12365 [Deltaproteobacteria bacterium]|nr:hypothetical protein [Deltaproteobacteria bacterium]
MTFNDTDPATWTDPRFHPDFGVDSAKSIRMLRECCLALLSTIPTVITRLVVDTEDGVLYCEITTEVDKLGELYCVESLHGSILRYGFFSENCDSTNEFEFYADTVIDVCRIVSHVHEGNDLEALLEEFRGST